MATIYSVSNNDSTVGLAPPAPHWGAWLGKAFDGNVVRVGDGAVPGIDGYNVFSLAFLVINNPAKPQAEPIGDALGWANLTDKQRQDIKVKYAAAGVKLLVSAFGDSQAPTTRGFSAIEVADKFAAWVKKYNLDGIDIDYLDDIFAEKSVTWVIDFTIHLRKLLPAGAYILTHAPLGPWFAPTIASGGYLKVNREVGNLIDWYNVQFFNQGNDYTTLDGLMFKSSSVWPQTSVFEIHQSANIPLSKIVIGKPATPGDAPSGGYVKPTDLAEWLAKGKEKGWNGGVFAWKWPHADAEWIKTVREKSWPI